MYGEHYQVYGATQCPNCNQVHAPTHQIPETQRSRFRLMQLMSEMSTTVTAGNAPVISGGAKQKFMVGLLISGNDIIVAASGGGYRTGAFVNAAAAKGYAVCPPRSATEGVNLSVVDRVIPSDQYAGCQADGASPAGACAAPRLIQYALSQPGMAANRANWEMSEIMYQPNTGRRAKDNLVWVHGLSAPHCATCENLVPLLMCPDT
ncbi:MAG: hypothetical protein AAGF11_31425 [Myxococcota bacterium]